MNSIFTVLTLQVILGAFDNLWHHEITEKLPKKPEARHELTMHTVRELIYGVIFAGLAWFAWQGVWAYVLVVLLLVELMVTLIDFIIEDNIRVLPPLERVLHTLLAINIGIFFAVLYPVVIGWAQMPSGLVPVHYGVWTWMFTAFGVGVFMWGIRDLIAVMNLHIIKVPLWQRNPVKKGENLFAKTYLVTGGTGFIGTKLVRTLIRGGHDVTVLGRDAQKITHSFGPHVHAVDDLDRISDDQHIDTIINLAGEPLAGGFWTEARKQAFYDSRLNTTKALAGLVSRLKTRPRKLINASAIGFYGDRDDDEALEERSAPRADFMSDLCQKWEAEARKMENLGLKVVRLRIGLVLDKDGGILAPLALSTKLLAGMIMGSGKQWMSWISREDLVRLILFIDENSVSSGAINATAPNPVRQKDFMKALGRHFKRPVFLWMPGSILRFMLRDMADLFLCGQKVLPKKASLYGFKFKHEKLTDALDAIYLERKSDAGHTKTYYNADCPICDAEIGHYKNLCARNGALLTFHNIHHNDGKLKAYGLSQEDVTRRIYVLTHEDEVRGGIDAMIEIWRNLPGYRWLAKFCKIRTVHWFFTFLYDGICAPMLEFYNRRWNKKYKRMSNHAHEN